MKNTDILSRTTNPIKSMGLIAKINALSGKQNIGKSSESYTEKPSQAVNYPEFIKLLNEAISSNNNIHDLFFACHKLLTNKLGTLFTSIGIINKQSNCINI
ncbi:MAG: hypothetical protein ACI37T_06850, partial [Candidatus Gastranaerophilaceae bacterium]